MISRITYIIFVTVNNRRARHQVISTIGNVFYCNPRNISIAVVARHPTLLIPTLSSLKEVEREAEQRSYKCFETETDCGAF